MKVSSVSSLALLAFACNKPPGAPVILVEPEFPTTEDDLRVQFVDEALDPNDDAVDYRFVWSVDGVVQPALTFDTVPANSTTKGQVWTVVVTPTDDRVEGASATAEVQIRNSAPTGTVDLDPNEPTTLDELIAEPSFTDLDDDALTYTWSWTVNGRETDHTGSSVPASATSRGEVWEVTVLANDGEADGDAATAAVTISNTAPRVLSGSIKPTTIFDRLDGSLSVVSVDYLAEDRDQDELTPTITWTVDGVEVAGNEDGTLDGRSFRKGQAVGAEVVVSDGLLDSAAFVVDPVLVLNTRPEISGVTIGPAPLTETTVATPTISGWRDEDADPEGFRYRWIVNGRDAGTGSSLTGDAWKKGDRVAIEVTPFDGEEAGAPVRSAELVVQNTAPTLAGVTLSPSPARTDDTLTATAGATADDDGDPVTVTYAWTVNGTAAGTGMTLAGTAFKKGDVVAVTATPTDGSALGAASTASITIANSAPVLASLTLSPTTVRTNDTIGATVAGSDADGDTLTTTVTWSVNGRVVSTGSSLAGSFFSKNDKVDASAVMSDGTDTSTARTASVTIANSAPSTPTLAMSPSTTPVDTDNIQCRIPTTSTDADGDTITYTFTWTRNGSSFTGTTTGTYTGDTVPASATTTGDVFVCTVRASDGTDSVTVTATATVTGTRTWAFTDTTADDVAADSLFTFFATTPSSSEFIFFEVDDGTTSGGAWCAERADWYATEYRRYAASSGVVSTGSWNKWWRNGAGGSWSSPTTSATSNIFGTSCDSVAYSWCSEWCNGGKCLAVMPGQPTFGESYTNAGWSGGRGWKVTVRVGSPRSAVCGF